MLGASLDVRVRRAKIADAPALAGIFRDSWRATYQGVIPHTHLENMIRRRGTARWRSSIRAGEMVLLIEFDGKNVGYATCGTARSRGAHKGEIYEIYLLPAFQGNGFGEYLFEACRYRLDERRLKGLVVWALAENTGAINFYWQLGGRPLVSAYERIGGARLEKIAFVWD
jgi:ribosomal protein S18 acetylase RimI-like enzyme